MNFRFWTIPWCCKSRAMEFRSRNIHCTKRSCLEVEAISSARRCYPFATWYPVSPAGRRPSKFLNCGGSFIITVGNEMLLVLIIIPTFFSMLISTTL